MTADEAMAEVFFMAYKALPSHEKESVIKRLMEDRLFREDVSDILVALHREDERSESYNQVRQSLKDSGKL